MVNTTSSHASIVANPEKPSGSSVKKTGQILLVDYTDWIT